MSIQLKALALTTGIIDVSHWDSDDVHGHIDGALETAKKDGVVAVIAKATQGKDYVDPTWHRWADAIRSHGLLFGAYHFGSNTEPGDRQADWFLEALESAKCDPAQTLLALDFERNPDPTHTMLLEQAREFADHIAVRCGRFPLLYGDTSFLHQVKDPHDRIAQCPLWPAAYGGISPRIPVAWRDWWLWQYTDGTYGPADTLRYPRITHGFGRIDRSVFKGDAATLAQEWLSVGKVP